MRRAIIPCVVSIIMIGVVLLVPRSGEGGCTGTCHGPVPAPRAKSSCGDTGEVATLVGTQTLLSGETACVITVNATTDPENLEYPGETAIAYVSVGTITFTLDPQFGQGSVRVVPGEGTDGNKLDELEHLDNKTYRADPGDMFTLVPGGVVFADVQAETASVHFVSADGQPATLLVVTVPLPATPEASPSPQS